MCAARHASGCFTDNGAFTQERIKNEERARRLESFHANRLVDGVLVTLGLPVGA